jgi:hypothetical protein
LILVRRAGSKRYGVFGQPGVCNFRSNQRCSLICDTAPIGLAFLTLDGRHLQINQRLTEICGISIEGISGARSHTGYSSVGRPAISSVSTSWPKDYRAQTQRTGNSPYPATPLKQRYTTYKRRRRRSWKRKSWQRLGGWWPASRTRSTARSDQLDRGIRAGAWERANRGGSRTRWPQAIEPERFRHPGSQRFIAIGRQLYLMAILRLPTRQLMTIAFFKPVMKEWCKFHPSESVMACDVFLMHDEIHEGPVVLKTEPARLLSLASFRWPRPPHRPRLRLSWT